MESLEQKNINNEILGIRKELGLSSTKDPFKYQDPYIFLIKIFFDKIKNGGDKVKLKKEIDNVVKMFIEDAVNI